jgi:hypothetical protein
MNHLLSSILYKYGWDMRVRNLDVISALGSHYTGSTQVLDVGSGDRGIAVFLPKWCIVGIDIGSAQPAVSNLILHRGSITSLPFPDNSFPLVTCVDTLEHLAPEQRNQAVCELVRVARDLVVIACPFGPPARLHDERFRADLLSRGKAEPAWLREHLRHEYPQHDFLLDNIGRAAEQFQKSIDVRVLYSEPLSVSRIIRAAATYSGILYILVNLMVGVLYPLFPHPSAENAYRIIISVCIKHDKPVSVRSGNK